MTNCFNCYKWTVITGSTVDLKIIIRSEGRDAIFYVFVDKKIYILKFLKSPQVLQPLQTFLASKPEMLFSFV